MDELKKLELSNEEIELLKSIFSKVNIPAPLAKIFVGLMDKVEALNGDLNKTNNG